MVRLSKCWYAAPQDIDRGHGTAPFEDYVSKTVASFANDSRVAWWEIFNEPKKSDKFSLALRDAGFGWAKSQNPTQPVLSCWDDNSDTEVVDTHEYSPPSDRSTSLSNPAKGGIVTEAGCRWYQNTHNYGAPLSWTSWLAAIKDGTDKKAPFAPGVMLSWEVMVGHSMTRYHWGDPEGTPEPAIPWCGSLYPDGSPVSYTEAAAIRRYTSGTDDFVFLETWLGSPMPYRLINSTTPWVGWAPDTPLPSTELLYELAVWPDAVNGSITVTVGGHVINIEAVKQPWKCTVGESACYVDQMRGGRCFIHEHPAEASSWGTVHVLDIATMDEVGIASIDMCAYGMRVDTGDV